MFNPILHMWTILDKNKMIMYGEMSRCRWKSRAARERKKKQPEDWKHSVCIYDEKMEKLPLISYLIL